MNGCDYNAGVWLSAADIFLVTVGAWLVTYEVVNRSEGGTHGGVTSMGGVTCIRKPCRFPTLVTDVNAHEISNIRRAI
jgi:hypothetical protein